MSSDDKFINEDGETPNRRQIVLLSGEDGTVEQDSEKFIVDGEIYEPTGK